MIPLIKKDFLSSDLHSKIKSRISFYLENKLCTEESEFFYRKMVHKDEFFTKLHEHLFLPLAQKVFQKELKASYNFLSIYDSEYSNCPVHLDRSQCKYTLSLCVDQNEVWPFYINSKKHSEDDFKDNISLSEIKSSSDEYLLNPKDVLFYFGTDQPHWRRKISRDNFCHMLFFHFVDTDYEGDLN